MSLFDTTTILIIAACIVAYLVVDGKLLGVLKRRRRGTFGEQDHTENNPFIPDWVEQSPGKAVAVVFIALFLLITALNSVHIVQPGYRGVLITMGKISEINYGEGLQFKTPYFSKMIDMKVTLEKEEVTESAASSDLQEVMTTLTVHFNVNPNNAWQMYQNMRKNYHSLLLKPIIQEDLKATTAKFTAEELIKSRGLLVQKLEEKLGESLAPYGIQVQTVNFVNFEFTEIFMDAIEAKVTAEQAALEAQNYLEQVKYEAQQTVINSEANRNATIIDAEASARKEVLAAEAKAKRIGLEANATARAIQVITEQMTPEYAQYLWLTQWDGVLPSTLLGSSEDLGIMIDTTP